MSNFQHDHWIAMAMADDTLVADQLLRIRHHRPSLLPHWTRRQRRTPRLPVRKAHPARASPTTPLTWTAATSVDGYEGSTRPASRSKAVDQSETAAAAAKRSKKKRPLAELLREEKLKLTERKYLKDELAAMHLSFKKQRASNESLKRIKLHLMSRETLNAGQAVLDPPETVEAHRDASNLASAQTIQDKVVEDESLVCAAATASAPSNQQPSCLLPDLNLPADEDFCDIRGLS